MNLLSLTWIQPHHIFLQFHARVPSHSSLATCPPIPPQPPPPQLHIFHIFRAPPPRSLLTLTDATFTNQRLQPLVMGKQNDGVTTGSHDFKLVGFSNFVRSNPRSDRFPVRRFHHVEFWCTDATNVSRRFSWGLGMPVVAKSDLSTGNATHASYLCRSGDLCFLFTAPYSPSIAASEGLDSSSTASLPSFSYSDCVAFAAKHGLGVRSVAVEVEDADAAFSTSVAHGARPVSPPVVLDGRATIAEVHLYGDVVLRYVSYITPASDRDNSSPDSWFLPRFEPTDEVSSFPPDFGIRSLDHAPGNVPELGPAVSYVKRFTGFHEFAEFTKDEVGTDESGLNSVVLANNDETVLLPLNEPVFGTKRRSPIQTYLEHNEGPGVHHLALMSEDIFRTLREMRKRSHAGGFEFMPPPPPTYYRNLKGRAGDVLTDEQIKECEELGILVDRDDEGTVLQIFTKPVGDRYVIDFMLALSFSYHRLSKTFDDTLGRNNPDMHALDRVVPQVRLNLLL